MQNANIIASPSQSSHAKNTYPTLANQNQSKAKLTHPMHPNKKQSRTNEIVHEVENPSTQ
jgi:hypothetical protein